MKAIPSIGPFLLLLIFFSNLSAQEKAPVPVAETTTEAAKLPYKEIQIDFNSRTFLGILPFDVPFYITTPKNDKITSVKTWYIEEKKLNAASCKGDDDNKDGIIAQSNINAQYLSCKGWTRLNDWDNRLNDGTFKALVKKGLKPNTSYSFIIKFSRKPTEPEKIQLAEFAETALKQVINKRLDSAKANRAERQAYDLNKSQLQEIIALTIDNYNRKLLKTGLSMENDQVNPDYLKVLENGIYQINSNLLDIKNSVDNFNGRADELQNALRNLKLFNNSYAKSVLSKSEKNNPALIDKAILDASNMLGKGTVNFSTESALNGFTKSADNVITILKPVKSANRQFKPLQDRVLYYLEGLKENASEYFAESARFEKTGEFETKQFADLIASILSDYIIISGSSQGDFKTRAGYYVSADLGVAIIPRIQRAAPYLGTNIYFRPVNKDRPLLWSDPFREQFGMRFSLLIGLTVTTLAKTDVREDLFADNFNLITGAGIRVADPIRLNYGLIWSREVASPLSPTMKIKPSQFVSLSFDIDVNTVFNKLFGTVTFTNNKF